VLGWVTEYSKAPSFRGLRCNEPIASEELFLQTTANHRYEANEAGAEQGH
jgi:hypothetical protein